jgi:dihydroflavonol-4-reductase
VGAALSDDAAIAGRATGDDDAAFSGAPVLVTGASGLLGYAIVQALRARGASVRVLLRGDALPGAPEDATGVEVVRGDLGDRAALRRGFDGVRFVFHVAADVRMFRTNWAESLRTNVDGTRNVVEACLAARPERLVFTSSAATLGRPLDHVRGEPVTIDETCDYARMAHAAMVYPHTKWLAEQEVLRGHDAGLDAVILHPTAVFGPGDWKQNLLPLFRATRGLTGFAVPAGWRTVCDVRDVADAHLSAARIPLGGAVGRFALGGESMSVRDLFAAIAAVSGGHPPRVELPAGVVRALGRTLEAIAAARGRAPLLSEEMALQSTLRVCVSSAAAERVLGYRPRAARLSIADSAAWYRARGLLP